MTIGRVQPEIDLAALLDASLDQWAIDARARPEGEETVVRQGGGALLRVGWGRTADGAGTVRTLDGESVVSVVELLREVRYALDSDFSPTRLRICAPPPDDGTSVRGSVRQPGIEDAGGRLPVFVLTGFLGSGKTTLLNRLLRDDGLRDTAVVVNELGAIGIDHLLVESADDSVVELAGGCLCCAVRGDLALTLSDLVARCDAGACAPFSRILIETSGLADPTPIESLLLADPVLAERMELAGITTCVDATTGRIGARPLPRSGTPGRRGRPPRRHQDRPRGATGRPWRAPATPQPGGRAGRRRARPGTHRGWGGEWHRVARRPRGWTSPPPPLPSGGARPRRRSPSGTRTGSTPSPWCGTNRSRARPSPCSSARSSSTPATACCGSRGSWEIAEAPGRPAAVNGAGHAFEPVDPRPGGWPDADHRSRLVLIGEGISASWCERLLDALEAEVRARMRPAPHAGRDSERAAGEGQKRKR